MRCAEADKNEAIRLEIKALTMAGSVPGLRSYLPWRGQEQGEEAAAVIFPLGVVWGFTFISPKRRGAGEGSQGSKGRKGERGQDRECIGRKSHTRDQGRGMQSAEERRVWDISFPAFHGLWT